MEETAKLRNYTLTDIRRLTEPYNMITKKDYIALRDATCSRLTLFNAHRSGEPCRFTVAAFKNVLNERWLRSEAVKNLEPAEQTLFGHLKVGMMTGKGTHIVPLLIPPECLTVTKILTDDATRHACEVTPENHFAFPSTGGSQLHIYGWDATHEVCVAAGIKNPALLTASKQRHHISTLYASLDLPASERDYFYKHMGHSKAVNEGTYQSPLPLLAVTKVGKHLLHFDRGK